MLTFYTNLYREIMHFGELCGLRRSSTEDAGFINIFKNVPIKYLTTNY